MVFVANLQLNPGETGSAVVVNLIDSNNQSYNVLATDVFFILFQSEEPRSLEVSVTSLEQHNCAGGMGASAHLAFSQKWANPPI
jgi:hypothetical protein